MGPAEGRDVREEVCRRSQPGLFPLRDSDRKLFCIPIDYDGSEQVQTCDAEVLAFRGAVRSRISPWRPIRKALFRAW